MHLAHRQTCLIVYLDRLFVFAFFSFSGTSADHWTGRGGRFINSWDQAFDESPQRASIGPDFGCTVLIIS